MTDFAMTFALLPDLGGGELLVVMFVVLLLFGPDKLPQLAKGIGKSLREFKRAASEVEREIKQAIDEVPDEPLFDSPKRAPGPLAQPTLTQPPAPNVAPAGDSASATAPTPGVSVTPAPALAADPQTPPPYPTLPPNPSSPPPPPA